MKPLLRNRFTDSFWTHLLSKTSNLEHWLMLLVLQNHIAKYARFLEQTTCWIPANIALPFQVTVPEVASWNSYTTTHDGQEFKEASSVCDTAFKINTQRQVRWNARSTSVHFPCSSLNSLPEARNSGHARSTDSVPTYGLSKCILLSCREKLVAGCTHKHTTTHTHTHTHTRLLKHAVEWSDAKGTICCLAIKHHPHTDRAVANVKEIKATANHRQKRWSTLRDPRRTSSQPASPLNLDLCSPLDAAVPDCTRASSHWHRPHSCQQTIEYVSGVSVFVLTNSEWGLK